MLSACSIQDWSRWKRTYQPGISWSGVGNNFTHNTLFNAPHAGILGGGNVVYVHVYNYVYISHEWLHVGLVFYTYLWSYMGYLVEVNCKLCTYYYRAKLMSSYIVY